MSFHGKKSFLKLLDFSSQEISELIDISAKLKKDKKEGVSHRVLSGKNVALIFEKNSTRTRCAFEVACSDLGMSAVFLDPQASQIGKKESIADTAKVLGRMFDGIEYRGYGQEKVEALAEYSGVPVFNGLTNEFHPTQILADFLTIKERFGKLKGIKLVYMGDARYNMGNSLMIGCAKMGMNFVACAPEGYYPEEPLRKQAEEIASCSGATLTFTADLDEALKDADVVYTDVWVSMGEPEEEWERRIKDLLPYKVTAEVMSKTKETSVFMHCLPAFHDLETTIGKEIYEKYGLNGIEVSDEVFSSEKSIVFDEAENRLHTIKAVLYAFMK